MGINVPGNSGGKMHM